MFFSILGGWIGFRANADSSWLGLLMGMVISGSVSGIAILVSCHLKWKRLRLKRTPNRLQRKKELLTKRKELDQALHDFYKIIEDAPGSQPLDIARRTSLEMLFQRLATNYALSLELEAGEFANGLSKIAYEAEQLIGSADQAGKPQGLMHLWDEAKLKVKRIDVWMDHAKTAEELMLRIYGRYLPVLYQTAPERSWKAERYMDRVTVPADHPFCLGGLATVWTDRACGLKAKAEKLTEALHRLAEQSLVKNLNLLEGIQDRERALENLTNFDVVNTPQELDTLEETYHQLLGDARVVRDSTRGAFSSSLDKSSGSLNRPFGSNSLETE